jgi:hypothetical protein
MSFIGGTRTSARDSTRRTNSNAHNLLVSPVGFATQPVGESWSGWIMSNESFIEWRWKAHTYGPYIDPDCEFEFRTTNGHKVKFRYETSYDSLTNGSGSKKGWAYGVTETEHSGGSINRCRRVSEITVSEVKREKQ